MELNASRVITTPSFDDDEGSLMNEYFRSVSKQIFENSSRSRRAESMSRRTCDTGDARTPEPTDEIVCCARINRTSIEYVEYFADEGFGKNVGVR